MAFIVYEATFPEKRWREQTNHTRQTSHSNDFVMLKAMQERNFCSSGKRELNVLALGIFLHGGRGLQVGEVTRLSI